MKKTVLVGWCFLTALCSNAQSSFLTHPIRLPDALMKNSRPRSFIYPEDFYTAASNATKTSSSSGPNQRIRSIQKTQSASVATTIGQTYYQLETNASSRNALFKAIDGSISAVWIMSNSPSSPTAAYADRGTGEAFYNDSTASWSDIPTARVDNERTGWPSVVITDRNAEIIVAHDALTNIDIETRSSAGNGTFSNNTTTFTVPGGGTLNEHAWPRLAVGGGTNAMNALIGDSNLVLHMISVVETQSTTGRYNNQHGTLLYSRSTDGGNSWNIIEQTFTQLDSATGGLNGIAADSYAIDAKDSVVAFVGGGYITGVYLMKSMDAGTTWKRENVLSFPANWNGSVTVDPNQVVSGNNLGGDTLLSSDGNFSVLIDNNHMVHVWYGGAHVYNSNPLFADSVLDYEIHIRDADQLMYWNESMALDSAIPIAGVVDYFHDKDQWTAHLPVLPKTDTIDSKYGNYNCGFVSHPTSGIDAAGNIYVAFDALMSGTNDGNNRATRGIYVMAKRPNGNWINMNWPYNVDSAYASNLVDSAAGDYGGQGQEQVYPTMARNVSGGFVSLIYQSDIAAGIGVNLDAQVTGSPNFDELTSNAGVYGYIQYASIDTTLLFTPNPLDPDNVTGIKKLTDQSVAVKNYPNPFAGITTITVTAQKSSDASLDVYNLMGQFVLATENKHLHIGTQNFTIDASSLNPGVYFYTLRTSFGSVTNKMIVE